MESNLKYIPIKVPSIKITGSGPYCAKYTDIISNNIDTDIANIPIRI